MKSKKRKKRRKVVENRHHLLFQRCHWEKDGIALAIRNNFIYMMPVEKHDYIHANLHDIPLPPKEDLVHIYERMVQEHPRDFSAVNACIWLAKTSNFEPFKACMMYQAELLKGGKR